MQAVIEAGIQAEIQAGTHRTAELGCHCCAPPALLCLPLALFPSYISPALLTTDLPLLKQSGNAKAKISVLDFFYFFVFSGLAG